MPRFEIIAAVAGFAIATAQVASAADLPVKTPAVVPPFSWTGLYFGGHVGWDWVAEHSTVMNDPAGSFPVGFRSPGDRDGFLGGVQLGFNWQTANWVMGVEGDWSKTSSNIRVSSASPNTAGLTSFGSSDDKWFATVTGRIGYAQDRWLIYAKGGAAWMRVDYGAHATGVPGSGTLSIRSATPTRDGWTVGGGIEWACWDNWSVKAEYDYMDFGTDRYFFPAVAPAGSVGIGRTEDVTSSAHVFKLGFNYRLGVGRP